MIYEGTSEVRETKSNLLVSEYEAFKMKQDESISDIFSRLTILTNGLKSLGKSYSEYEIVRKILRSLTSAWHTKATVIEESKNLSSNTVDELIGSLMTYELNLKKSDESEIKKKSLALKANMKNKEPKSESESSSSDEDSGEFSMFTRRFRKFLKKEGKSFRKSPFINRRSSKTNPAPLKKPDKIVCYNCRKSGHIQTECPETIRVRSSKVKGKKSKAMICT